MELGLGPSVSPARSPTPEQVLGAQPPRCPFSKGGRPRLLGSRRGVLLLHPVSRARCWAHTAGEQTLPVDEGCCPGASL